MNVTLQHWQNRRYAPTPRTFSQQPQVAGGTVSARLQSLAGLLDRCQFFQVASPASGRWTAVGIQATVTPRNQGYVLISTTTPPAGTFVLAGWAADAVANGGPGGTFGRQYSVAPRFTVTDSQLRVAALRPRAALPSPRQPVRWAAVAGR